MVNIEYQTEPLIKPANYWIEVDHASANIDYPVEIDPAVLELFDLVVDPTDERNQWLVPRPEVAVLAELVDHEDGDEKAIYLIEAPDGRDTRLIYEFNVGQRAASITAAVTLERDSQLVFPVSPEVSI